MTDEITLAFAHPSERSIAMENPDIRDRISLRDHIREVEIGAFQAERGMTQRLCFNVVVEVGLPELAEAVSGDDVDKILSYDAITEAIDRGLSIERLNLLETLAVRVAEDILTSPLTARVFVRIEKLDRGPGALGVEIVRDRASAKSVDVENTAHPLVVFLPNAIVENVAVAELLDNLKDDAHPLVLCVDKAAHSLSGHDEAANKRIDLLSIEQNAWRLAAADKNCCVVETRTELDWAMKNGQTCVWAPSKLVLDSTDAPKDDTIDAGVLALWFAEKFEAAKTLAVRNFSNDFKKTPKIEQISLHEFLSSD
jgi:dihydroneopterin aldolase